MRKAIGDSGDEQRLIKTFPRKGVRFIAAVHEAPAARNRDRPAEPGTPDRPSLVVLPFADLSRDPAHEYFVDGVTESLTTDLSRMAGIFVIGPNTAFTYKGRHVDPKQVGRELGVRYVLEGSVQRVASRMRINVQLIDAETGNHLWAERFDKPIADLFDMQDEIGACLANQLGTELVTVEARRAARAPHPDSMDFYLQGMAYVNRGSDPVSLSQAREFFEQALCLDAGNIEAMVGTAFVDAMRGTSMLTATDSAPDGGRNALAKVLPTSQTTPWRIASWASSRFSPNAPLRASPNVSGRWRWIEIWPPLTRGSGSANVISVEPRKLKPRHEGISAFSP